MLMKCSCSDPTLSLGYAYGVELRTVFREIPLPKVYIRNLYFCPLLFGNRAKRFACRHLCHCQVAWMQLWRNFMLKFSHSTLIYLSGLIWLAVGLMLLRIGVNLLIPASPLESLVTGPLVHFLTPYLGDIKAVLATILIFALAVGYLKGRFVLGKSARKGVERILTFPNPTHVSNLYSAKYYILLGGMVALGISIKYLGIPNDIRGMIDVTIGIALLTGALIYFRYAATLKATCDKGNP